MLLKVYIDSNTCMRSEVVRGFKKDFYKLMNNAVLVNAMRTYAIE